MENLSAVHLMLQTEGVDIVNGSSPVAVGVVEDVDAQETIKQTGMQGNLKKDQDRVVMVRRVVHHAVIDRGEDAEATVDTIEVLTVVDRLRVRKNMEMGRVPVDVGDHPDASSAGISAVVEEVGDLAHKMGRQNKVVKRALAEHLAHVSADVGADQAVLVVKTRSLNLLLQRLKIPQELLSPKKASLCRIQLLKVQLRSSHAVMLTT